MSSSKSVGLHPGAWAAGGFLCVYLLFPHLLLLPYVLVAGHPPPSDSRLTIVFWPVRALVEWSPHYKALMQKESEWTGVH